VKVEKVGGGGQRNDQTSFVQPSTFNLQPLLAVLLSLIFHGLIVAGIAIYINYAPAPDELAQLDLTSVDLSFSETPDETAAAAPASAPMPPAPPPKPSEPQPEPPPEEAQSVDPSMPAPDTTDLPQPEEASEKFEDSKSAVQPSTSNLQPPLAPRQAKVDAPPKPRRNIKPDYPKESRQRGEQGDVTLEIDVNVQGTVDDVRVAKSSGFPLLDEAAINAARAARFTPAKSGGSPVSSTARLTLNFKLK